MTSLIPPSPDAWLPLVLLLAAFLFNILVQIACCRVTRGRRFLGTVAAGFFAGALGLIVLSAASALLLQESHSALHLLPVNLLIYFCLGYGYANFVNLGQSSIRIRLFEDIRMHRDGLPLEDIRKTYDEAGLLSVRLHRLTESGDLKLAEGAYRTGRSRFVLIANIIFLLKRLVLSRESEFED